MKKLVVTIILVALVSIPTIAQGWLQVRQVQVRDGILVDAIALSDGSTIAIVWAENQYGNQLQFVRNHDYGIEVGTVTLPNQHATIESIVVTASGNSLHVFVSWSSATLAGGGQVFRYTVQLPVAADQAFHHRVYIPSLVVNH